jgi:EF-hand domain
LPTVTVTEKLTQDEYARMIACRMGVPEDQARAAFSRLDRDGDGLVTADEIAEAVRDYHFNDDPAHPEIGCSVRPSLADISPFMTAFTGPAVLARWRSPRTTAPGTSRRRRQVPFQALSVVHT